MKKEAKKVVFPQLAQWVVDRSKDFERPFARDSLAGIKHGLALLEKLPDEYSWLYCSTEAHKKRVDDLVQSKGVSPIDVNRIHWNDYARNWEAYAMMSYWRGVELILPAIRSINLRELVAPAVLSRSLLELSVTFLRNANTFQRYIEELPDLHLNIVVSNDLELLTNKAIWGSRLVEKDDPLLAKNVLTTLQSVSKNPNASELFPTYEYLCEVAHPNMMGNARFWSHIESMENHGYEKRVISRYADTNHVQELLENTLWALSWGSIVIHNAFIITSGAVHGLAEKLK